LKDKTGVVRGPFCVVKLFDHVPKTQWLNQEIMMFTITCNNGPKSWQEEQNIALDDGIARLRALGRGRYWLYVSGYDNDE
jgi:hypothetical protein